MEKRMTKARQLGKPKSGGQMEAKTEPTRRMKKMLTVRVTDELYDEVIDCDLDISGICREAIVNAIDKIKALQGRRNKKAK
jgi:post-segregation antitoxin (ccd killing protein)